MADISEEEKCEIVIALYGLKDEARTARINEIARALEVDPKDVRAVPDAPPTGTCRPPQWLTAK